MLTISKVFDIQFDKMRSRNWEHIYIMVDMHDTVFKSTYGNGAALSKYPYAFWTLERLTKRDDVKLIYWSSSNAGEVERHLEVMRRHRIRFDFINENPLELSNEYADFSKKFYTNIIIDDKAGFDPDTDWKELYTYLDERD